MKNMTVWILIGGYDYEMVDQVNFYNLFSECSDSIEVFTTEKAAIARKIALQGEYSYIHIVQREVSDVNVIN